MTDKKKSDPFKYLDTFYLATLMMKISMRAGVAATVLGVRAIAGTTRAVVRKRHQRRYLR